MVQLTNEDQPKFQKHGTIVSSPTQNFVSCDVTTNPHTASWRDSESVHRFWKPIDPDEYSRPKEYLDSAVSWFSTNDTQCSPPNIHSESANTFEFTKNEIKDTDFTVAPRQLFCWAPLLSGSLCHRCDSSGRCPIHGRIVKRDKITGRPISMNDRKLIQAEMESKRLARQKKLDEEIKKKARRHYPGLANISKKEVGVRGRLEAQVIKKKTLRKRS